MATDLEGELTPTIHYGVTDITAYVEMPNFAKFLNREKYWSNWITVGRLDAYKFSFSMGKLEATAAVIQCQGHCSSAIKVEGQEDKIKVDATLEILGQKWQTPCGYHRILRFQRIRADPKKHVVFMGDMQGLYRRGFVEDDRLYLKLHLKVELAGTDQNITEERQIPAAETLAEQFGSLLTSPVKSDVTVVAGGKEFACNWNILACRAPVFQRMLESGLTESSQERIEILDVEATTMTHVLRFLYTGRIPDLQDSTYVTSPIGVWYYPSMALSKMYEIKQADGSLKWFESSAKWGNVCSDLVLVEPQRWSTKFPNGGTLELNLSGNEMIGTFQRPSTDAGTPAPFRTSARNLQAEVDNVEHWGCLMRAADKYCIAGLVELCEGTLKGRLGVWNAAAMLRVSTEAGMHNVKAAALNFIIDSEANLKAVQESKAFDDLGPELVSEILQSYVNALNRWKRPRVEKMEFVDGTSWTHLSLSKLRRACVERGIRSDGAHADLVALLQAHES